MMETEQNSLNGRRGLFMVTRDEETVETHTEDTQNSDSNQADIADIISMILSYEDGQFPPIPDEYIPILKRLRESAQAIQQEREKYLEITKELDDLKEEQTRVKREHESYLADLISAHTEFDRALEIFQYHSIPMALLGSEGQIIDANEVFCTIFAVARSEITKQFPPLSKYIPENVPFTAPDGEKYTIVFVKPPIVPFDHEASSLALFVPPAEREEEESHCREILPVEVLEKVCYEILLPFAIVDRYHTVRFINYEMTHYLGREHKDLHLRDIASCGFISEITEKIDEVLSSGNKVDYETTISHKDNTTYPVWLKITPITAGEESYALLTLLPNEEEPEEKPQVEQNVISEFSSPFLKTLLELNPSPMVLFDHTSEIILANEGFSELIGVSSTVLQGQKLADIGIRIPDVSGIRGDIEILPDEVCIESPYGTQCYSGLVISYRNEDFSQYIMVLQPQEELTQRPEIPHPHETETQERHLETSPPQQACVLPGPAPTISLDEIPIPAVVLKGAEITDINTSFIEWSGIQKDTIADVSSTLISHIIQSRDNRSLTFSIVFPTGLKTYQIVSRPVPSEPDTTHHWFLDQTDTYATIETLKGQIQNASVELKEIKNQLTEERSPANRTEELSQQIDIVEFELSGGRYAMDIGMVREVVEMLPITPLPKTPPYIIGIINLRGEVTHVVDLAVLLGEGVRKDRTGQKIIIVPPDAAHGEHLGIIVDNVRSVTEIGARQVTALGDEINHRIQTRIKGIIKVTHDDYIEKRDGEEKDANLVIWLDMKEILNQMAGFHT